MQHSSSRYKQHDFAYRHNLIDTHVSRKDRNKIYVYYHKYYDPLIPIAYIIRETNGPCTLHIRTANTEDFVKIKTCDTFDSCIQYVLGQLGEKV